MRHTSALSLPLLLLLAACAAHPPAAPPVPPSPPASIAPHTPPPPPPPQPSAPPATPARQGPYIAPGTLDLIRLLPPPPAAGSAQERKELDQMLRIQEARTPDQSERAHLDEQESIYRFADALGNPPGFDRRRLPVVDAFFARVAREASRYSSPAKKFYDRPRPFLTERRLAPVVEKPATPSYPSGHSTWAHTVAVVLADMVPERRAQIFARAEEFGHNRVVGGVHYPSDVQAGWLAGTAIAEALFASPRFEADEAAAERELRHALGLPPRPKRSAQRAIAAAPRVAAAPRAH